MNKSIQSSIPTIGKEQFIKFSGKISLKIANATLYKILGGEMKYKEESSNLKTIVRKFLVTDLFKLVLTH